MLRTAAVPLLCACFVAGCLDESSASISIYSPTLITADPSAFVGSVRCGPELRKYVVTLIEVTTGTPEPVGTAPPTSCTTPTSFGTPIVNASTTTTLRQYIANIDGYDRDDIVPEGGIDSGSRVMKDLTTMETVPAKWTTTCGEIAVPTDGEVPEEAPSNPLRYPTIALSNIEVILKGCLPFRPVPPSDGGDAGTDDASADGPLVPMSDAADEPMVDAPGSGSDGAGESGLR